MNRVPLGLSVALLLLGFVGCGGNKLSEITGTVSYDGQPIKDGNITFVPAEGKGPTAAGVIIDGRFKLKIEPGSKSVDIKGYRITGKKPFIPNDPKSPMVDARQQILPDCYNTKTELTCDITSAKRVYDFALEKAAAGRSR